MLQNTNYIKYLNYYQMGDYKKACHFFANYGDDIAKSTGCDFYQKEYIHATHSYVNLMLAGKFKDFFQKVATLIHTIYK